MIINTFNEESIYDSISELIGIKKEILKYFILKHGRKYSKEEFIKSQNIFIHLELFLKENQILNNMDFKKINEVTINHLTTRMGPIESIKQEPLYNLFEALLEKTTLNKFMKDKGFNFEFRGGRLITLFDSRIIDWTAYYDGEEDARARMINSRLQEGGSRGVVDKCVNGFLLNGQIYKHTEVAHIERMPEIIEDMFEVLDIKNAIQEWSEESQPYIITFKQKVENIVFDQFNRSKLNNEQKKFLILKYCLYFLTCVRHGTWREEKNLIIRLKDEISVPISDIKEVTLIENH
ncbi:hypothetical protein QWJ34_26845 [Saccharibacillus sp. CPCC 101409]|uniref:hypothetical protein n=1 Tax=Saccharibacillus sp. CPCC 101409 TaxID=3058041 RepID=UPI002670EC97|nr:hypothetical protein [Saccharibacillus sp. CPCC 101409]MDO3413396.1 hypothetical protein [Saccharibacillus sp. CPCC 101409]